MPDFASGKQASTEPTFFADYRHLIDQALTRALHAHSQPGSRLAEAMHYSLLLGGKRIRPILTLTTAHCFGASTQRALEAAIAAEMIHAYSLIHDDLPAMDDDDLRRGHPTCHKAFDEATAILAGDALQALAFEVLAGAPYAPQQKLDMIAILAKASGARGMVLGQAIDLESEGKQVDLAHLQAMHGYKTGALIQASVQLGALCVTPPPGADSLFELERFAQAIGLAFQIQDDILDLISDTATLGKQQGADLALQKSTYPSLLGLAGAQAKLREASDIATQALSVLKQHHHCATGPLSAIQQYIIQRLH